jgi:peptidoglycan/xylan/chitin deacetylase (PgdA/CDA1 family)
MHGAGYEISDHSLTHQKMNDWAAEEVAAEVEGGRASIASTCGVPEADIVGFRQPFLQSSPTVRQVGCCSARCLRLATSC